MVDGAHRPELEGLSSAARRSVLLAEQEAGRLGHGHVGTEHLLAGLAMNDDGAAREVLREAGITAAAVRQLVAEAPPAEAATDGTLPLSARASRAFVRARRFSQRAQAEEVGTVHVLQGVLDVEGTAALIVRRLNGDTGFIARAADVTDPRASARTPADMSGTGSPASVDSGLTCPRCHSPLELSYSILQAAGAAGPRDIAVFSCSVCRQVIGASGARTAPPSNS